MSGVEQALFEKLSASASVTVLVGTGFFRSAPPRTSNRHSSFTSVFPAFASKTSTVRPMSRNRACKSTVTRSPTRRRGKLRRRCAYALDGWRDLSASVAVKGSSLITDRELWEPNTDPKFYRVSMDFMITHNEATT